MQKQPETIKGFSLIELLVSLVIFSLALLSLAELSTKALLLNHSAALHNMANQQAYAGNEILRALANNSIGTWQQELGHLLPAGKAEINVQAHLKTITINWYDKYHEQQKLLALHKVQIMLYL